MMKELQNQPTLAELAAAVAGEVVGDGSRLCGRAVHPDDASAPTDLAVAMHPTFVPKLASSKATMAIVAQGTMVPENVTDYIVITRAQTAMSALTARFDRPRHFIPGIHESAVIDPTATIGKNVTVGPQVVIGARTVVGDNSILYAQVTVGSDVTIGADGHFFPGVRIGDDTRIGDRAVIHSNAVLGADGFSFVTVQRGSVEDVKSGQTRVSSTNAHLVKISSLGPVVIGDDVEIGANTAIDRATLRETRIGNGTKIDNLVQIGHNVEIGMNCMICGQVGIAGSVKIGDRVVLAGRSGIADNVQIGSDAIVAAAGGVGGNVPEKTIVMGTPALPREKFQQQYIAMQRLPRLLQQMEALTLRIKKLEDEAETR